MKALKKEDVEEFYKKRYWDAVSGDLLPSGVCVSVCDLCVNAGPKQAAKLLQRIVGYGRWEHRADDFEGRSRHGC